MFYAKNLSSSSLGFLKEDFLGFFYIHIWKSNDPLGRGQFWPLGFNLNKLSRHLLAKYLSSSSYVFSQNCKFDKTYQFTSETADAKHHMLINIPVKFHNPMSNTF
jgi:hypothetical protein